MKKTGFLGVLAYVIFSSIRLFGETVYLKTVQLGSFLPQSFVQSMHCVRVINKEEIEEMPITSIGQVLDYALGVDMGKRNPYGMQGEISIRGCTFQQVLVLINGVRVNDPQTAHHNMDLPVTINDVEKVEVLYGQGSSLYGADAFGGVVNIVTKKPKRNEASIKVGFSEHNTRNFSFSFGQEGRFSKRISFEKLESDGFRYDTDFDNSNLFGSFDWDISSTASDLPRGKVSLDLGFMDKEFGAYDFYTPGMNFPSKEWTKTYLATLKGSYKIAKRVVADYNLFFRRHDDKFILDITRPLWYVNKHKNFIYGGNVQSKFFLKGIGNLALGGEINEEEIDSSTLGEHSRLRKAVFAEYQRSQFISKLDINTGLRLDSSGWGQKLSPYLGIGGWLSFFCRFRTSFGKAFRVPSFTELYYESPANIGNADLKPEENLSYQVGMDFFGKNKCSVGITLFRREEKNLIDWIKKDETETKWSATNIGKVNFNGLETFFKTKIGKKIDTQLGYIYVDSESKKDDYISKYGLRHISNQVSLCIGHPLYKGVRQRWYGVYKEKHEEDYFVLDTRVLWDIRGWRLFFDVKNILDEKYEEIIGVSQPGRWLGGGVSVEF